MLSGTMASAFTEADLLEMLQEIDASGALSTVCDDSNALDVKGSSLSGATGTHTPRSERNESLRFDYDMSAVDKESHAHESNSAASADLELTAHALRCRNNRKRRKEEMAELRQSAMALEEVLSRLRKSVVSSPGDGCALTTPQLSKWRLIAQRMRTSKLDAIRENKRLREMVEEKAHELHSIRAICKLPSSYGETVSKRRVECRPRGECIQNLSPGATYHKMFENIASSYREQVASACDVSSIKLGTRKVSMEMVSHDDRHEMRMQVVESKLLPLSFAFLGDSTWDYLSKSASGEGYQPALVNHGDDLFGNCRPSCANARGMVGHLAIRRYVEEKRLTFVWECNGCCQCDASNNPIGRVKEQGWCTFEPSDEKSELATLFRIQVQYTPLPIDGVLTQGHIGLSADNALQLYRTTIGHILQTVESVLLKDGSGCSGC